MASFQQVMAVPVCSRSPVDGPVEIVRDMDYYLSISPLKQLEGVTHGATLEPLLAYVERCAAVGWSEKTSHDVFVRWTECMVGMSDSVSESTGASSVSRSSRRRKARQVKIAQADAAKGVKASEPGYAYVVLFDSRCALGVAEALGPDPTFLAIFSCAAEKFAPGVLAGTTGRVSRVDKRAWVLDGEGEQSVLVADVAVALNQLMHGMVSESVMKRLYARATTGLHVLANDRLTHLAYPACVLQEAQVPGLCYLKSFCSSERLLAYVAYGTYPRVSSFVDDKGCDKGVQVVQVDQELWHVVDEGDKTLAELVADGKGNERVGGYERCENLGIGHLLDSRCKVCRTHDPARDAVDLQCHGTDCLAETQAKEGMGGVPVSVFVRGDMGVESDYGVGHGLPVHDFPQPGHYRVALDGGRAAIDALMVRVEIPLGFTVEILGTEVTVEARETPFQIVGLDSLAIEVHDSSGCEVKCLAVWVGGWEDKVRCLHRLLGEAPNETFSRFWTRIGAKVAVGMSMSAVNLCDGVVDLGEDPTMVEDQVDGVIRGSLPEGYVHNWGHGLAVAANGVAIDVAVGGPGPLGVRGSGRVWCGLRNKARLAFARRVPFVQVSIHQNELGPGVMYRAVDDYALDDGGPSDEEGFMPEY